MDSLTAYATAARRLAAISDQITQALRGSDHAIAAPQGLLLAHLKEGDTQAALQRRLGPIYGGIGHSIRRLIELRLIQQQDQALDKRSPLLVPTAAGEEIARIVVRTLDQVMADPAARADLGFAA